MIANRAPALALAAVLGVFAVAHAQTPASPTPPGTMVGQTQVPGSQMHRGMRQAERIKALHDALNIRPDQEGAFQAFVASMRPEQRGATPGGQRPEGMGYPPQDMAAMTTPARLDAMGRMMDERVARTRERFQRHAAAAKALYAVLSPEQRRTLDALPDLMGHGMGMGGGRHRGLDKPGMGPGADAGPPGEHP
jgi:protein CpxP